MKTKLLRALALMLALVLCMTALPIAENMSVSAATSSALASEISGDLPIVTYAMPLSGASRVYSYSNSSLSKQTRGYYIDTFSDQIVITKISSNGKAVYCTYPSSSSSSGYRSRWFKTEDIIGLSSVNTNSYVASNGYKTYRMCKATATTRYGGVDARDACTSLGVHKVGSTTYYPTVFPISSQRINNVSGVRHKLALATTAGSTSTQQTINSSTWQYPMKNAYCTWRSSTNMSWANHRYGGSGGRNYHLGLDIYGSNGTVYAAASGKIMKISNSPSGANGRFIIIQHTINGQTVYSFYAHLKSIDRNIWEGKTINAGTIIGVAGGSGYNKNSYYGTHLHFAIVDTYWSSGAYYGYATWFSGNKVKYDRVTYYNPNYIIKYNRLP